MHCSIQTKKMTHPTLDDDGVIAGLRAADVAKVLEFVFRNFSAPERAGEVPSEVVAAIRRIEAALTAGATPRSTAPEMVADEALELLQQVREVDFLSDTHRHRIDRVLARSRPDGARGALGTGRPNHDGLIDGSQAQPQPQAAHPALNGPLDAGLDRREQIKEPTPAPTIPQVVREALEATFEQKPGHLKLLSAAVRELGTNS
ncbi:hypothetical protein CE206_29270 (plasmid) [Achromobacter xylosoxidans]|uniref:hypothetical protein n=1 Tax=Alcaligenes xylosoxydans xylosoxydans TaxID=85698 RepID=UPI000DD1713E|nr:hypothetical protein [Achromobacter xylosoxidans]AXA80662.1 hypothetical protein CE206_29270 [Achromobacter xylosoxidans]